MPTAPSPLPGWLRPPERPPPVDARPRRTVPDPDRERFVAFGLFGAAAFLFVTLLYGDVWFPGTWSAVGLLIFLLLTGTIALWVVRPFRPWVRAATAAPAQRLLFLLLFSASLVIWFVGVDALQPVSATGVSSSVEVLPILTPYGLMPTVAFTWGAVGGYLNLQLAVSFLLLSYLWAGVVLVQWEAYRRARACAPTVPAGGPGLRDRATTLLTWAPLLGVCSGCCSPPLLELLVLGALPAAGPSFSAFRSLNWMWDGVLELASLAVMVVLIRRATRAGSPLAQGTPEAEGVAGTAAPAEARAPEDEPATSTG